jgi:hypothetical protein
LINGLHRSIILVQPGIPDKLAKCLIEKVTEAKANSPLLGYPTQKKEKVSQQYCETD